MQAHSLPIFHTPIHKKTFYHFMAGLLLLLAAFILLTQAAHGATQEYDPYADSVTSSSQGVVNADNAVGAPNGTYAQMVGLNAILTMDMGQGEEGTESLQVYFGPISAVVNIDIEFLDSNQTVISSENRQLSVDPNASTQTFAYNWKNFGKAYRYVRISSSQAGAGVNVDALQKLGYIGATPMQDLDGDGIPDRTERQNGTDPLVFNPTSGTNNTTHTSSSTPAKTGSSSTPAVTTTNSTPANTSTPAANSQAVTSNNGSTKSASSNTCKKSNGPISGWIWFWIIILVIGALISWFQAWRAGRGHHPKATPKPDDDIKFFPSS